MPRGYRRSPPSFRDRYSRRRRWEDSPPRRRDSPYDRRPYSRDSRERYDRRRSRSRSWSRSRSRSPAYRRSERSRSKSTPPRVTARMREDDKMGYSDAFRKAMSAARQAEMALSSQFPSQPNPKGPVMIDDVLKKNLQVPSEHNVPAEAYNPPNPISSTYVEAPSSTTSLGAAMRESSLRDAAEISPFSIREKTNVLLTSRFERLEYLAGSPVELQKCLNDSEVSLEDISVVIERNLLVPQGNPSIRMSFIAEVDALVLPRAPKEGDRCIFDRPEIKAFNHDANVDDDDYVETRKVVVRRDVKPASSRPPKPRSPPAARASSDSRDARYKPLSRFEVDRGRGRGWGRGPRQRGGLSSRGRPRSPEARPSRRQEMELMDDDRLPDFSQRPNKGYLQPNMRNPTDIPKHGSYFLHDDREDFEMERGRGYRGSRPFRRRAGRFSRYAIDRRTPYAQSYPQVPRRPSWGKFGDRSPKGMDLDKWKHDKFEEVQDEETIKTEDSKANAP